MRCTAFQVAGDHRGGTLVALGDEVVEILVLSGLEGFQPKIVNDEQGHTGERLHLAFNGPGGTRSVDLREQS